MANYTKKYEVGDIFSHIKRGRKIMFIQTEDGKMSLAQYNFRKHHGHPPKGRLEFRDGDTTNCDISNLRDCKAEPIGRNYKRYLGHETHFKTKQVDYSKKRLVRVDHKTWKYIDA